MSQQQQQQKVQKPQYEVQSNNTTIIMTKSMKEVNDVWAKSKNCELFQFNPDGSKYLVNIKVTPLQKTSQFKMHFKCKTPKKAKQKKHKLDKMVSPVTRQIKRRRDRDEVCEGGVDKKT